MDTINAKKNKKAMMMNVLEKRIKCIAFFPNDWLGCEELLVSSNILMVVIVEHFFATSISTIILIFVCL